MRSRLTWMLVAVALVSTGCLLERAPLASSGPIQRVDGGWAPVDGAMVRLDGGDASTDAGRPTSPPGVPGAPRFASITETSARVSWSAPSEGGPVERYELERAPDTAGAAGSYEEIAAGSATSFVEAGLTPGTSYWYRVRARNEAGVSGYSPAAELTTAAPLVVRRVQHADSDGWNPTATLSMQPVAGNLLVAVGLHRFDEATPDIAGWDLRVHRHFETGGGDRRALTVWTRVAGTDEPRAVSLQWSPGRETRLLVQELSASEEVEWRFEAEASVDSGSAEVDRLAVGTTGVIAAGDLVLIGAFGSRDSPESEVTFSGLAGELGATGGRSVASSFAHDREGGGVRATMVSWSRPRRANAALLVFRLRR